MRTLVQDQQDRMVASYITDIEKLRLMGISGLFGGTNADGTAGVIIATGDDVKALAEFLAARKGAS
jgi:hypothetical protein